MKIGLLSVVAYSNPNNLTILFSKPLSILSSVLFWQKKISDSFVWPLLNAGGRLTTPYQSLTTLLAGSLDSFAHIQELIGVNELRKWKSRDAFERALASVDFSAPFLIFIDEQLEHGILWLVAGKLTEMSHKPSAVFTLHDGFYVGSLRAPPGIDLVQILEASRDALERFGGHAGAAGCTIRADMMPEACDMLRKSADVLYGEHDTLPLFYKSILFSKLIKSISKLSQI
jgi:single-stranded DNA-specific DHH superfamily exonuclease